MPSFPSGHRSGLPSAGSAGLPVWLLPLRADRCKCGAMPSQTPPAAPVNAGTQGPNEHIRVLVTQALQRCDDAEELELVGILLTDALHVITDAQDS